AVLPQPTGHPAAAAEDIDFNTVSAEIVFREEKGAMGLIASPGSSLRKVWETKGGFGALASSSVS
ncbi:unnamed protein product, partial [Alternaria alternata]